jgi:site-specific recombinase XerC
MKGNKIERRLRSNAYARAVKQFFDWTEGRQFELEDIDPLAVAAYIEKIGGEMAKPSVKQQLAAIRQMFDYLVTGGILSINPAASVRGPNTLCGAARPRCRHVREFLRHARTAPFKIQIETCTAVFEFIEGWYNPHSRHSALDYHSPINYERIPISAFLYDN